jgi:hypothetical protein
MSKTMNICLLATGDYRLVGPDVRWNGGLYTIEQKNGTDALGVERWFPADSIPVSCHDRDPEGNDKIEVPGPLFRELMDLALEALKARRAEEEKRDRERACSCEDPNSA